MSDSESTPGPQTQRRGARSTRNPRRMVEPDTDEDLEDAPGEEEEQEDDEDEDEEMEDSEEDAEGEEDDDMDDIQVHPPPPTIRHVPAAKVGNNVPAIRHVSTGKAGSNIVVSGPSISGPVKSVERKEMDDDDDDDEELSELESVENEEEEEDEDDEDEDEEDEEEDEEGGRNANKDAGADGDSDNDGSRSATPDLTKLTKRQRGAFEEDNDIGLLALSNEAQKKKHLTAEEHAVRRAEMARRRKNLSEKRNEEEKLDTINKLLSKPSSKRRTRAEIIADERKAMREGKSSALAAEGPNAATSAEDTSATWEEPMDPLYTRWVSNSTGSRVAVPEEWLAGPIGEIFTVPGSPNARKTKNGSEKKDVEMTLEAPKLVKEVA